MRGFYYTRRTGDVRDLAREIQEEDGLRREERKSARHRDLAQCEDRLTRLTDAFLDDLLDKETFEARKVSLMSERLTLREALDAPEEEPLADRALKFLELGRTAYLGYDFALPEEKREIVREFTSNLVARGKTLEITVRNDFDEFMKRPISH